MNQPTEFRGIFRIDEPARAAYSEAAGIAQIIPRAVAVPVDADDVVTLVKWAAANDVPLIPRGSGSSMPGGAIGDGVIVDLSRLKSIAKVDLENRTIRCGPGVTRATIDTAARGHGLTFPVDPSSGAFATVGGMASTNAAGAHTLKYGSMRPWVQTLDCIFTDGSRAEVRRGAPAPDVEPVRRFLAAAETLIADEERNPSVHAGVRKESSGYALAKFSGSRDLVDLLVGSEGTLVLIVGLELRLAPLLSATASVLGAFDSLDAAVIAAGTAREAGAVACELLDRTFLDVARNGGANVPVPDRTEAVLLAEVEGASAEECGRVAALVEKSFLASGASTVTLALDAATEHAIWELRHAASPILSRLDPSLKSMQLVEDGCVPPNHLADYVRGVRAVLDAAGLRGVIFGHAGDGHVHVNALVDFRNAGWRAQIDTLVAGVSALTARLGGTLSGEHGDGRLRAPLLRQVWSAESLGRFAAVKAAFDPRGILNPGTKLATDNAAAVDRVKYDPALAPLPPAARAVLARVERDRAYASFRLSLLAEETERLDAPAGGV
ncbi:MAG: linked oxidase domain protein [Gemmatimonadetes bacterium]|nr:linked oxidase domain protein [Gemmatimonadota bacterium]